MQHVYVAYDMGMFAVPGPRPPALAELHFNTT